MYTDIYVNRKGPTENSHMQTIKVIGNIKPNRTYRVNKTHLQSCELNLGRPIKPIKPTISSSFIPPHTKVKNTWNNDHIYDNTANNILGSNGEFQINGDLTIPIIPTTQTNLDFFNCKLLKHFDHITIDSPKEVPLTIMQIGKNYVKDYLLTESGGGCYLEFHDVPHFHMPLNDKSGGHLILGKIIGDDCCLSAFRIPYNYAIYTAPFTIHCDAFLVGDYMVAYTVTDNYSTVLLKNNGAIVDVNFV